MSANERVLPQDDGRTLQGGIRAWDAIHDGDPIFWPCWNRHLLFEVIEGGENVVKVTVGESTVYAETDNLKRLVGDLKQTGEPFCNTPEEAEAIHEADVAGLLQRTQQSESPQPEQWLEPHFKCCGAVATKGHAEQCDERSFQAKDDAGLQ